MIVHLASFTHEHGQYILKIWLYLEGGKFKTHGVSTYFLTSENTLFLFISLHFTINEALQ